MTFLKGREMVYNGFEKEIFLLSSQPIVSAEPEKLSASEKSSTSEHLSDYYEYISPKEKTSGRRLKLLNLKQMLQRLPIALPQMQAANTSKTLLNEILQIIYSLYQAKEITKKVYDNIINSIKV